MLTWPRGCLLLAVIGVAILALPARLEGPRLVEVADGHAVSVLDAAGIVPLVAGSAWLHSGVWVRRRRLEEWVKRHPGRAVAAFSASALGLGLLLASAFSAFYWWWAVGAVLFAAMHLPIVMAASARDVVGGQMPSVPE
jgi:hypothetical protein